ncbi:MAG: hypothetical protein V4640_01870 [Verrucomicrobiota bacterium]
MNSPRLKKYVLPLAVLAFGLPATASAATYSLVMHADVHPGKYTVDPNGSLESVLSNYDDKAKVIGASVGDTRYWTFCLESSQYFQDGKTYNADPSSAADSSGPGPSFADAISAGTAYLYKEFVTGNLDTLLAGFSYSDVASGGARLQRTIWWLEGEVGGVLDSGLEGLLLGSFGNSAGYLADYTGSEVGVLNLTRFVGAGGDLLGGDHRQDNLVYWGPPVGDTPPVPDGGTSVLLLSLSLGGLGMARRFLRA